MNTLIRLIFVGIFLQANLSYAGGVGIDPTGTGTQDLLNEIAVPGIDLGLLTTQQFESNLGTEIVLKFEPSINVPSYGKFEVVGIDPATFSALTSTFYETKNLSNVMLQTVGNNLPINAIHTDTAGRFMLLEVDKTADAFAKDILIAPVFEN